MPAAQGLLPQTVDASQLRQANAMNRVGINTAQISGAALGGIIVGSPGPAEGWPLTPLVTLSPQR
jgi:predicted MFS family arabinose efflux permease